MDFIVFTTEEFPLCLNKSTKDIKFKPLINLMAALTENIDIVAKIETYDELESFFEEELDNYENDREFKECRKMLNDEYDIYICKLHDGTELLRDFLFDLARNTDFTIKER